MTVAKEKLVLLTLETLNRLGEGSLKIDFEATLQALVKDCLARPSIEKAREVAVVFKLVPVLKQDGTCDDVALGVQVTSKSPAKALPTYVTRATVNGGLKFAPLSPGNPEQGTMDYEE